MKDFLQTEVRPFARHDEREIRKPKLCHTVHSFDIFNALANWAVSEAGGKKKVFGEKPQVADYLPTDPGQVTGEQVDRNIGNLGRIGDLLEGIYPGFRDMLSTGTKSSMALMRGEIPQDVQDQIRRSSAFQSLSGGFGGSPMGRALTARDLGRTSLDLTQMGSNAAQRWAQLAQASYSPFIVSSPQAVDASFRNKLYSQGTQQEKYNVAAAPDPGAAGTFNLQTALGSMAASFGLGALGGAMKNAQTGDQTKTGILGGSGGGGSTPYYAGQVQPSYGGGGGAFASSQYPNTAPAPTSTFNDYSPFGPYSSTYGGYSFDPNQWPRGG